MNHDNISYYESSGPFGFRQVLKIAGLKPVIYGPVSTMCSGEPKKVIHCRSNIVLIGGPSHEPALWMDHVIHLCRWFNIKLGQTACQNIKLSWISQLGIPDTQCLIGLENFSQCVQLLNALMFEFSNHFFYVFSSDQIRKNIYGFILKTNPVL